MATLWQGRRCGVKTKPRVWVVEMLNPISCLWEPTIGTGLTRDEARDEQRSWERGSDDKFRITKYERAS